MPNLRWIAAFVVFLAGILIPPWESRGQDAEVDLALVLAIDVSYSVDANEHRLQMEGFGQALQSETVQDAIKSGEKQKIAVIVFQWSDMDNQRVIVPWTIIDTPQVAHAVGEKLRRGPRAVAEGGTGISGAMIFAATLFSKAPAATRNVIDISTDGRNNMGRPTPVTRDFVVAQGLTINGLAITNEWPELARYLERQVIGGSAAFVEEATSYDDFGAAMMRKLVKEIRGPGIT
jgi:hypothetical protein